MDFSFIDLDEEFIPLEEKQSSYYPEPCPFYSNNDWWDEDDEDFDWWASDAEYSAWDDESWYDDEGSSDDLDDIFGDSDMTDEGYMGNYDDYEY
jgi:hypothetical protein